LTAAATSAARGGLAGHAAWSGAVVKPKVMGQRANNKATLY